MKKLFLSAIVCLFPCVVYGQISTDEEPVSFKSNASALRSSERTMKTLVSFDMKKIEQEDLRDEANGAPPSFGYQHKVNYTLENSGEWTDLPGGGKIWRLAVSCEVALSINLLYDKFWLPDGANFFCLQ